MTPRRLSEHPVRCADVECRFEPDVNAASQARHAIAEMCGSGQFFKDAQAVTSELVANVIQHTASGGMLRGFDGDPLRIEAHDTSSTLPVTNTYQADVGGHGLRIVGLLASRWGSKLTSTGKVVWAEFDRPVLRRQIRVAKS